MGPNDELQVSIDGYKLETVTQFKYVRATITEDQEMKIRIDVATS